MLHCRNMPIYLVMGWGVLDLLFVSVLLISPIHQESLSFFALFLLGQFSAVTGWTVMGDHGIRTSLAVILAVPTVVALLAVQEMEFETALAGLIRGLFYLGLYGCVLNLPLIVMRLSSWRFCFETPEQSNAVPFYQFSIRELMIWTFLVALVAGLWSATRPMAADYEPSLLAMMPRLLLSIALLAFVVPWSVWGIFFWVSRKRTALAALLVSCLWGVLLTRLTFAPSVYAMVWLITPVTMIVHLVALQLAGFRLRRGGHNVPLDRGPDWQNAELWKKVGKPALRE